MAVVYDPEHGLFTLKTKDTDYQMKVDELGYLLHLYYGSRTDQNMDYRLTFLDRGFSGNPAEKHLDKTYSLDTLPQEYPFKGTGDYRGIAFKMENADGAVSCDLRYLRHEIRDGKYSLNRLPSARGERTDYNGVSGGASVENVQTLVIVLADAVSGVEVELYYSVYEAENVITRAAKIRNGGADRVVIRRALSCCLDSLSGSYDLVHFHGRHTYEMQRERTPVGHAAVTIGSRRGTSSHQHNPAVILADHNATEESGAVTGCILSFSGSFLCEAEKDQFEQTRFLIGMNDEQLAYPLMPGEELEAPECILSYTKQGFRDLSLRFHDFLRAYVIRDPYGRKPHPVLINSWEAAYFDFDGETIVHLAEEAKDLGMDMVVMDDGWFGRRNDDLRALGDWTPNEEKLGCSLGELIRRIEEKGLKFGIWIEPEMVNEDSDLYRAHPDWALKVPGKAPVYARNQLVLDFSRKEVRDSIFNNIAKVLDQGHVSYVKWDMNRSVADVYSLEHVPGKVRYEYVAGVYAFLKALTERYPELIIEGCSGGGGRFDAGMLHYEPQIWASDNSDACDRVMIQYGLSYFYPSSTVGAHVSAVPNHQTGRITPLSTRGITAMAGTFGYELDPAKLTKEERDEIRTQIRDYKRFESLVREGDYYRLSDPFTDGISAWAFVSPDRCTALISYVCLENHGNMDVKYIRAAGLDPEQRYAVEAEGNIFSGAALMEAGLPVLPPLMDYKAGQILLKAVGET